MRKSITICLLLFLFSCSTSSKKTKKETPVCMIFCDFTQSVDTVTTDSIIIQHAREIVNHYKSNHNFYVYLIGDGQNSLPVFDYENAVKTAEKGSERGSRQKLQERLPDSLVAILKKAALQKPPNTCILQALEVMQAKLNNLALEKTTSVKVFILSDMLESCRIGTQEIRLENKAQFNNAMATLEKMQEPQMSFKTYENLLIYPVIISQQVLDIKLLQSFWHKAFDKYGYKASKLPAFATDISFNWLDKKK